MYGSGLRSLRMLAATSPTDCLSIPCTENRVGASVAEVDHHEVWQRARITAACVAREHREAERLLDEAERWLKRHGSELHRYG